MVAPRCTVGDIAAGRRAAAAVGTVAAHIAAADRKAAAGAGTAAAVAADTAAAAGRRVAGADRVRSCSPAWHTTCLSERLTALSLHILSNNPK